MKTEEWKYFKTLVADFSLTDAVISSGEVSEDMDYNEAHKIFTKYLAEKFDNYEKQCAE